MKSGGKELALELEEKGYGWIEDGARAAGSWLDDARRRDANIQSWMAALETAARARPPGRRWLQDAPRRAAWPIRGARASRPPATRSGASRTSRRSPARSSSPAPRAVGRPRRHRSTSFAVCDATAAPGVRQRPVLAAAVADRRASGGRDGRFAGGGRTRTAAVECSASRPAGVDVDARAFAALNTAFVERRRLRLVPDGVVSRQPIQLLFVSVAAGGAGDVAHPRDADRARRQQPGRGSSRPTSALGGRRTSPTRSPKWSSARTRSSITTRCRRRAARRVSRRQHARAARARSANVLVALVHARRQAGAQRRHRDAGRRGRRVHAERPLPRPTASGWSTTTRRSITRVAALPEPRDLQGHPRRQGARRSSTARSSSARTRRRPTPSRPTGRCCCPTTRRSTPSRSSRSSPTT